MNVTHNPLSYILLCPDVVSEKGLREINEHISKSETTDLSVFDGKNSNKKSKTQYEVKKEIRDTQLVPLDGIQEQIKELYKNIVMEVINPFYDVKVDSGEIPQILSYSVGGHYKPHIDAESIWITPNGDRIWKKTTDRDISTVLFLNDDFEGGDLVFPELKIRVRPEPGLLIAFPSTHFYLHGVEPVTKGKRYAIVNWLKLQGTPWVEEINKELSQKYGVNVT